MTKGTEEVTPQLSHLVVVVVVVMRGEGDKVVEVVEVMV